MKRDHLIRLIVALAILILAALLLRGYVTDDTYIHLRYAQNLIERGEFSFNPGERTYGATSPMWVSGLVFLQKLGMSPLASAWWLGFLSAVMVLLLVDAFLESLPWPDALRTIVLWLVACDAWFLRWSSAGMETPMATAALLVLLWPLLGRPGGASPWYRFLMWGVAAGMAGLVRPEFLLLAPATLPWLLWAEQGRSTLTVPKLLVRFLLAVAGWAMALAPWFITSWQLFGRLIPETATAKSYGLTLAPAVVLSSVLRSLGQLAATQGFIWVALVGVALLALQVRRGKTAASIGSSPRAGWALVGIAATWSVLLIFGYAVKQVWVISRYLSPLSPVLLLAMAFLATELRRRLPTTGRLRQTGLSLLVAGCLATYVSNIWLLVARVRPHTRNFSQGVRECYLDMGEWLKVNSAHDSVVAALDIGAVGYASQLRVLDLMGLVSPEVLAVGRQVGFQEMVQTGQWLEVMLPEYPEFLLDRTPGELRWENRELYGVRFELVRTCEVRGVGLREPEPWTVALYRLHPVTGTEEPEEPSPQQ